jgi:glutaredoxin
MNTILIQELSTPGCQSCEAAKETLKEEIKPNYPQVEVEYVDILSDKGQKMVQEYGVMSSPGIIVNDELVSAGGLNKAKLIQTLEELT